jgi:hypothetical protein
MTFTELAPAPSDPPEPFTDRLRLAVAAYLARFKGSAGLTLVVRFAGHLAWADVLVCLCLLRMWRAGLLQGPPGCTPCRATLLYEVVLVGRGPERLHLGFGICDRVCGDGESRSGYGLCLKEGAWGRADGG